MVDDKRDEESVSSAVGSAGRVSPILVLYR
jgi:hypothetical protein